MLAGPLSACGGESSTLRVATDDAGELCRVYRLAVIAARFNGTPLAVPDDAVPVPPDGEAVTYRLPDATVRLVAIETAVAGTVTAADSAAAFESALGEEFASIDVTGESGNELVPMTFASSRPRLVLAAAGLRQPDRGSRTPRA